MRYVVIGAGAVGGTIGALLAHHGREVVLVARGAHLEALRTDGLRLAQPNGILQQRIPAIGDPAELELRESDVLLLAVKSQNTVATLDQWADRPVGEKTAAEVLPVVCAQNGVENERAALRRFARVYGLSVLLPSGHVEPGLVTAVSDPVPGVLPVGRYPEGVDDTAMAVAADLSAAGFVSEAVPDVQRWKYSKLLRNLANAIEALTGEAARSDDGARLRELAVDEGRAVLAAAGIATATPAEEADGLAHLTWLPVPGAERGGGSSWQSLVRGTGSIESDYLNGEIVLLGRVHGVDTPVNASLQRLAAIAATKNDGPGNLTSADILKGL